MPDKSPSIRELVWLARLRPRHLFDEELGPEAFSDKDPACEQDDCLPWVHTVKQCERFRIEREEQRGVPRDTPIL